MRGVNLIEVIMERYKTQFDSKIFKFYYFTTSFQALGYTSSTKKIVHLIKQTSCIYSKNEILHSICHKKL